MSQRSLERQPLMDVGNFSQSADTGEVKKTPTPAVSTTSQVIDLCTEGDMTFAFNQSVLPVGANKSKTKAPAKPRVTAPKPATAKPKAPAAKKAKKSKVEVEFDKLSPLEQLEFLRSKAQLLEQLELDPSVQNATTGETIEAPVTTSASVANSDDLQLCTLRLELGAVLSSEAELRAKERKIRLQIKRLQRKMTLALPPIVVTHRETVPQGSIADTLFVAPSFAGSIVSFTESVERAKDGTGNNSSSASADNENDASWETWPSTDKPLWRLAQQDEQFDYAVAPRLLSVERDAVLLPELPQSLARLASPVAEKVNTVETPHSPEQDTPAVGKSPVVSPYVVQTEVANDISTTDMCVTSDFCIDEIDTGTRLVSKFAADNNNANIDIYEVTSSNESNAGDAGDVMNEDCIINEDTTNTVAVTHNQDSRHIASDEHRHKRQKVHNAELNSTALATVRTGLFTNNFEECVLEVSQAVLTQPNGNNNNNINSDCVIDLCSPELIVQNAKPSSRPSNTNILNSSAVVGTVHPAFTSMEVASVDVSASNSVALSDSTPNCANCVIHYVPSDYVESSSEEQYLSQSQPTIRNTLRSCISKKLSYSQQSEVNTASENASQSHSQSSHAPIPTTTNLSFTTTPSSKTSLNMLTSTTLPDFSTMSIAQLREIVHYYGLKEDTRLKMTSLLRAMWCRVHGKKTRAAAAGAPGALTEVHTAHSSTNASLSETVNVPLDPLVPALSQRSIDVPVVGRNTQSEAQPVPQLPQPSSQHQLLVSSYLTQSLTANTLGTLPSDSFTLHSSATQKNSQATVMESFTASSANTSTSTTATVATTATTATVSTKTTTATRFELTLADLKQFIRNHETLYQQVLQYTPIELDAVHASIVSTGVFKVSRTKLLEMLDSLAIFVSNSNNRNGNNNGKGGKGKKRKQLSQSSV